MRFAKLVAASVSLIILLSLIAACAPAAAPSPTAAPSKPAAAEPAKPAQQEPAKPAPAAEAPKPAPAAKAPEAAKPAGPPVPIRVAVMPGSQAFPVTVMEKLNLGKKYNLDIQRTDYAGSAAAWNALRSHNADIAFGGWTSVAKFRSEGLDTISVYSMQSAVNDVMVLADSPYKTYSDIKGVKMGEPTGPQGSTWTLFRLIATKWFGYDPGKDNPIQVGAPPLIAGLLEKKDVGAIIQWEPQASQMMVSGKFRSIGTLGDVWEQKTGKPSIALVSINSTEEFGNKYPEGLTNFIRAYIEAANYMRTNKEIWTTLAESFKITDPKEIDMLRDRSGKQFLTIWNDEYIEMHKQFFKEAVALGGKDVFGIDEIPAGTFTTKYVPKDATR